MPELAALLRQRLPRDYFANDGREVILFDDEDEHLRAVLDTARDLTKGITDEREQCKKLAQLAAESLGGGVHDDDLEVGWCKLKPVLLSKRPASVSANLSTCNYKLPSDKLPSRFQL